MFVKKHKGHRTKNDRATYTCPACQEISAGVSRRAGIVSASTGDDLARCRNGSLASFMATGKVSQDTTVMSEEILPCDVTRAFLLRKHGGDPVFAIHDNDLNVRI